MQIVPSLVVLVCFSAIALAQEQVQPVSLIVHLEGKRKLPAINGADLVIFDNDQKLASAAKVEPASGRDATFAILVDASGSQLDKVEFIKKSVLDIFDAASSSGGSKAYLFTFADVLRGSRVSRADLQQAISNFGVKQGAPSPLYASIVQVAKFMGGVSERRLIFVVTDGDDTTVSVSSQDAVDACLKSGVTIIPVGLLSSGKEQVGKTNLLALANGTGGRAIILNGPANLKPLISDILQSEYIVTFTPTSGTGLHHVKIEMSNAPKGVSLQAPEGYYGK